MLRPLFVLILTAAFVGPVAARPEPGREPSAPRIAIPPAILQKSLRFDSTDEKQAAPLAERVQLALEADAASGHRFVERIALEGILREQSLALSGATASASSVRTGRLLHADWILQLRLRADDLEAAVIDALRADLLGQAEISLPRRPDESWLLPPSDSVVETARSAAVRATDAARARAASFSGKTVVRSPALRWKQCPAAPYSTAGCPRFNPSVNSSRPK